MTTEYIAILDRSGSMMVVKNDTEGAFDAYVAKQREEEGEANLTLVQFDTKIEEVYAGKPLAKVPPLQLDPGGMTALYDAIGITVTKFDKRLLDLNKDQRPEHVIVLILTDGLENSSTKWGKAKLKRLIGRQVEEGWTFLYLGANQDAVFEAGEIGIDGGTALTYDVANMGNTIASASASSLRVRRGGSAAFTDEERKSASRDVELRGRATTPGKSSAFDPSMFAAKPPAPPTPSQPKGTRPPGAKPTKYRSQT